MYWESLNNSFASLSKGFADTNFNLGNLINSGFNGVQNSLCRDFNNVISTMNANAFALSKELCAMNTQNLFQFQEIKSEIKDCCCNVLKTMSEISSNNTIQDLRDKLYNKTESEQTNILLAAIKSLPNNTKTN